jgi:hypothetical protein
MISYTNYRILQKSIFAIEINAPIIVLNLDIHLGNKII